MMFFCNCFSQPIKLKFGTGIQNWMLILIFGSKSCFGDDYGQYDTKTIILRPLFSQTPLRNSAVMATPKVPGEQKLFERVCYMLKLKVTKFQLPTPNGFWAVLKKPGLKMYLTETPTWVNDKVDTEYFRSQFSNSFFSKTIKDITMKFRK